MKKLLIVALLAASIVSIAEAGRCRRNCGPCPAKKCEQPCPQKKCVGPPCVVDCTTSYCEGEKPDVCYLEPARANIIRHESTSVHFTCADPTDCQVVATDAQLSQLRADGHI